MSTHVYRMFFLVKQRLFTVHTCMSTIYVYDPIFLFMGTVILDLLIQNASCVLIEQNYRIRFLSILLPNCYHIQQVNMLSWLLNSSTIDELGRWCLKRLVEPGSNEARERRYPWQPYERPPPKAPSH